MTIIKVAGTVVAVVLLVIGLEYLLIYAFDVNASILQSLKFLIPIIVALGLIFAVWRSRKVDGIEQKKE